MKRLLGFLGMGGKEYSRARPEVKEEVRSEELPSLLAVGLDFMLLIASRESRSTKWFLAER